MKYLIILLFSLASAQQTYKIESTRECHCGQWGRIITLKGSAGGIISDIYYTRGLPVPDFGKPVILNPDSSFVCERILYRRCSKVAGACN